MSRAGLLPEYSGVTLPVYDGLRLTIPAREALVRAGNRVAPHGSVAGAPLRLDPTRPPSVQVEHHQTWDVTLAHPPRGLVLCLIGHGVDQHRGLRLDVESEYPGEWPADSGAIAWHDRGDWLPCPRCGASLVWYEAAYVPGYRVCSASPHHHVQLSRDGRTAKVVR